MVSTLIGLARKLCHRPVRWSTRRLAAGLRPPRAILTDWVLTIGRNEDASSNQRQDEKEEQVDTEEIGFFLNPVSDIVHGKCHGMFAVFNKESSERWHDYLGPKCCGESEREK